MILLLQGILLKFVVVTFISNTLSFSNFSFGGKEEEMQINLDIGPKTHNSLFPHIWRLLGIKTYQVA